MRLSQGQRARRGLKRSRKKEERKRAALVVALKLKGVPAEEVPMELERLELRKRLEERDGNS